MDNLAKEVDFRILSSLSIEECQHRLQTQIPVGYWNINCSQSIEVKLITSSFGQHLYYLKINKTIWRTTTLHLEAEMRNLSENETIIQGRIIFNLYPWIVPLILSLFSLIFILSLAALTQCWLVLIFVYGILFWIGHQAFQHYRQKMIQMVEDIVKN